MKQIVVNINEDAYADVCAAGSEAICLETARLLAEEISVEDVINHLEHEVRMQLLDSHKVTVSLDATQTAIKEALSSKRLWREIAASLEEECQVIWL